MATYTYDITWGFKPLTNNKINNYNDIVLEPLLLINLFIYLSCLLFSIRYSFFQAGGAFQSITEKLAPKELFKKLDHCNI